MPLRNQECGLSVLQSVSNSLKFSILILKEKYLLSLFLPQPRVNPATLDEFETGLEEWHNKMQKQMDWTDPAQPEEFRSFPDAGISFVSDGNLIKLQLGIHQKRRQNELQSKVSCCKRLKPSSSGLGLTKEAAEEDITEKERKEKKAEEDKTTNVSMKIWRMERDDVQKKGVAARRAEKSRVQE